MSRVQRIRSFVIGLLLMACGVFLLASGEYGPPIIACVLAVLIAILGLRMVFYYFTMARHMVGGMSLLYGGVLMLDAGAFVLLLMDTPNIYLMLYLVGYYVFSGAMHVLRGLEAKKFDSPWKKELIHGVVNVLVAVICVVFIGSPEVLATIYCIGLFCSAVIHMVDAFRTTDIVYIQ